MRLLKDQDWRAYLAAGDETSRELLNGASPLVEAMNVADRFFSEELYAGEPDLGPVPALLAVNAHMYLLAAARTALSGHQAAVFPLVRTALESACYAYLTAKMPEFGPVWMERHRDEDTRRKSRRAFGTAVSDTAKAIGSSDPEHERLITECYDVAIDFGGHPNPKGLLPHLRTRDADEDSQFHELNFTTVYGAGAWNTQRGLLAWLDYAVVVGMVLLYAQPSAAAPAQAALSALNARKNALADEMNAEALRSWSDAS